MNLSKWMVRNAARGVPRLKPTRISVSLWIKDAWENITQKTFVNSFYGAGYNIARIDIEIDDGINNYIDEDNEMNGNIDILALN